MHIVYDLDSILWSNKSDDFQDFRIINATSPKK